MKIYMVIKLLDSSRTIPRLENVNSYQSSGLVSFPSTFHLNLLRTFAGMDDRVPASCVSDGMASRDDHHPTHSPPKCIRFVSKSSKFGVATSSRHLVPQQPPAEL